MSEDPMTIDEYLDQAATAVRDHDVSRMECHDHDRACCPADDAHDMSPHEVHSHTVAKALEALGMHWEDSPFYGRRIVGPFVSPTGDAEERLSTLFPEDVE